MAKQSNSRRKGAFLEGYKLDERYLLKPERAAGRAGLLGGFSPDGLPVLIKVWPRKKGQPDTELEEIWRHELRQLHRLAGFPGASENVAHLRQAGLDDQGFYLVLDPGQRQPLQVVLENSAAGHWLKQYRLAANRVKVWRNLGRLGQGLETLHAQGLLHRKIDEWAVLTNGGNQPDFQLTGFEWSMKLTSHDGRFRESNNHKTDQHYSFQHDWLMVSLLAARMLGVNVNRLLDLRTAPFEIAEHLSATEAKLLRVMAHGEPEGRLNGELVAHRINDVVRSLSAELAALDPRFHLVLRLGAATPLAAKIRAASDGEVEVDDIEAQLDFVRDDLSDAPLLMAIRPRPNFNTIKIESF